MTQLFARGLYSLAASQVRSWTADTIEAILVNTDYGYSSSHQYVDDIVAYEISATNYVGGFGGTGRKTLAGKSTELIAGVVYFYATIPTWTALGGGVNTNVGGLIIAARGSVDDTDAELIGFWDSAVVFPYTTNGEDLSLAQGDPALFSITV